MELSLPYHGHAIKDMVGFVLSKLKQAGSIPQKMACKKGKNLVNLGKIQSELYTSEVHLNYSNSYRYFMKIQLFSINYNLNQSTFEINPKLIK